MICCEITRFQCGGQFPQISCWCMSSRIYYLVYNLNTPNLHHFIYIAHHASKVHIFVVKCGPYPQRFHEACVYQLPRETNHFRSSQPASPSTEKPAASTPPSQLLPLLSLLSCVYCIPLSVVTSLLPHNLAPYQPTPCQRMSARRNA